jgi:hypothetical protein
MEVAAWAPCKIELTAKGKKPKWAYVTVVDVAGGLREGMSLALYFRQQDGSVVVAAGEVVKVLKDGAARVRIPWFAAASLAAWAGVDTAGASGRIAIYNCAVQYEILEEEGGRGIRVKQIAEEE